MSRSLVRLLRRSTAEIVGSPLQTFLHPDDRPAGLSSYFEAVADAVGSRNGRTTVRCLTGLDDVVLVEVAWTISETGDDCAPLGVFYLTTGAAPPPRWSVRPDANPERPA